MILREDIDRLARLKSDNGILSAYIRLDPRLRFVRYQAETQFKGALKQAQRRLRDSRWQEALERESAHVLKFLSNSEFPGRGLAIFSCRPDDLWEVLSLDVLVNNLVDVDSTTKTGVLAGMLSEFPRYVVTVLQRDQARIYTAQQRMAEEPLEVKSEVPGQHDQGGRSQMRFERHIEFHVAEHLKKVADELQKLSEAGPMKLAFGGTDETVEEILKILPEPVLREFIGKFPVDYKHDTEQQILEHADVLWRGQQQADEEKLVTQVFDAAKSDGRGVLGVAPTLEALVQEKVRTLVLVDRLKIDGSVCNRCDYFAAQKFHSCPLCGGEAEQRDLVDRAVEKAVFTSADVEVVSPGDSHDRLLAEGGIGALLRY